MKTLPLKILIVEDSADDCDLILRVLKKNNLIFSFTRIDTSEGMAEALKLDWDIVLSDYKMPHFGGPQALQMLKASGKEIPFIIISGTIGEEIAVEMMRAGANDYILKDSLARLVPAIYRELESFQARTKMHETEAALRNIEEQLRQAQKMEAIGQLAGGVAHDFNNMLSVAQIYCRKIKECTNLADVQTYVDKILGVQTRSAALTRQLLIFSRRQPCEAGNLDVTEVVENMRDMVQSLVGGGIEVGFSLDHSLKQVFANPGQLEQVVMNLAVNAKDAMPQGGRLQLSTGAVTFLAAQRISGSELPAGEYIVLEVSDSGIGMSKEIQERIFEPFFTTKGVGSGTGLGLSIIYGIIHQCKGAIAVSSVLEKGTQFRIYLPVSQMSQEVVALTPRPVETRGGQGTILLVEDEEELRSLFAEILTGEGYKVLQSSNGEEALEVLEKNHTVDLVITDMVMPKIGGQALFQKAQKMNHDIKFIYMSGYFADSLDDGQNIINSAHFLEKPFTEETLRLKVRAILNDTQTEFFNNKRAASLAK